MLELPRLLLDFFDAGGSVLWLILLLTVTLWTLILGRLVFFFSDYPSLRDNVLQRWEQRNDKTSWYGESMRKQWVSELDCALGLHLKLIPSLIALLPMLGLLGTVTGMIQVFDVLALTGAGNPRSMADGVSAATIPTMAGMVAALSALPVSAALERKYQKEMRKIKDQMPSEVLI
ncbi:MAG: MotA/TolQ/ExbB proton channel family protein [Pseudomonadota bacterium]